MADPFAPSPLERIKRNWFLIVFAIGTALVVWMLYERDQAMAEPGDLQLHSVIGFGVSSGYDGGTPIVRTRDANGNEFAMQASPEIGSDCDVGDPILVEVRGVSANLLSVHPCSDANTIDDE